MAKTPTAVEIRAFQVGFGDCLLLSFVYSAQDKRHVLIDFGTMGLPPSRSKKAGKSSKHMLAVAKEIAGLCSGRLTAVVTTHRHEDHISGFATGGSLESAGDIIKKLRPRVVLQPWTEDPDARRNATQATRSSSRSKKSFVASLAAMHHVAGMIYELAEQRPSWMGAELTRELRFLGMDNIKNESAVRNLIAMGKAKGATAVWAHHGSRSGLERHLPGVKIHVLGPPDLRQSDKIRKMRKRDPDQFWHLLAGGAAGHAVNPLATGLGRRTKRRAARVPREARWFRDRLNRMRGEQLLEIVRTLDEQMNNTSLILLFEMFGKKLLFSGDAQIENWSWALEDAPDAKKTRALLAGVDVYKVGHHGSLNATPKELLWKGFKKRAGKELRTVLSTLPGKHGKARNKTEVPRKPLLDVLKAESTLFNTDDLKFGANPELCHVITIVP